MESWWRVGQRVAVKRDMTEDPVWNDTGIESREVVPNLEVGSTWLVIRVEIDFDGDVIFELKNLLGNGYWAGYFAPVKDTSIELLRALLNEPPDPVLVREEMDALTADVLTMLGRCTR